jgi:hypothetical protein
MLMQEQFIERHQHYAHIQMDANTYHVNLNTPIKLQINLIM